MGFTISAGTTTRWPDAWGEGWDAEDRLEALVLLGSGRPAALNTLLAARPAGHPFARLAGLDAGVRSFEAGPAEIQRVQLALTGTPPDRRHRWWMRAIVAERKLIEGDFGAVVIAASVLTELPEDADADLLTTYVRGRLRRARGLAALAANATGDPVGHGALRAAAIADMRHCGFLAEVAVTRAHWSALRALVLFEEPETNLVRVLDARADLGGCDPVWVASLDYLIGLIAILVGDHERLRAVAGQLTRALPETSPLAAVPDALGTLAGLIAGDAPPSAVEDLDRAIDRARGVFPRLVPSLQVQAAHVLGDLGHPAAARFGLAALDTPADGPVDEVEAALLACRVAASRGVVPGVQEIVDLLDRLVALGQGPSATVKALRLANDCRHLGATDEAARLRAWAAPRLRTDPEGGRWETRLAGAGTEARRDPPVIAPPAVTGRDPDLAVDVLAPVLAMARDGHVVPVRPSVAKLLLALVVVHPEPLHVEQAADLLWPDLRLEAARLRLNTVVHRLRRLLAPSGAALQRAADVLLLDPAGLDVDLLRLRHELEFDKADAGVVAAVRGNLCHVQFPYDDLFIDHRRDLGARWRSAAAALVARGDADPATFEPARRALGLDPGVLGG